MISSIPAFTISSMLYSKLGLSTIGNISFGIVLVMGRNRVPSPATGMTALRTFFMCPGDHKKRWESKLRGGLSAKVAAGGNRVFGVVVLKKTFLCPSFKEAE